MGNTIIHPTAAARIALARRFGLPYSDTMQDWEWEVATPDRFNEFLTTYRTVALTDEERFSLMEILIQCVEELHGTALFEPACNELKPLLEKNLELHRATIEYWSVPGSVELDHLFRISPFMRNLAASSSLSAHNDVSA